MKRRKDHVPAIVEPEDRSRRRVVKTVVGGVTALAAYQVLPAKWGAPLIESVFVPAHALTSGFALGDPCSVDLIAGDRTTDSVTVRVTGFVTPPTGNLPTNIAVTATGGSGQGGRAQTVTSADGTFAAEITIGGGPGITGVHAVTTVRGASGSATCSASLGSAPDPNPDPNPGEGPTISVLEQRGNQLYLEVTPPTGIEVNSYYADLFLIDSVGNSYAAIGNILNIPAPGGVIADSTTEFIGSGGIRRTVQQDDTFQIRIRYYLTALGVSKTVDPVVQGESTPWT